MNSSDQQQFLSNELYWELLEEAFPTVSHWRDWQIDIDMLIQLTKIMPKAKILDVGCGTGKYSISFAKKAYQVFGWDDRKRYLKIAENNAIINKVDIQWLSQDLQLVNFPSFSFDLVTMFSCIFSYLKTEEDALFFLKKAHNFLSDQGMILIELVGREALESHFQQMGWISLANDAFLLWERKIIHELNWINESLILIKDGVKKKCTSGFRIFYTSHLLKMLEQIGFVNVKLYQDFQESVYSENASRLVIVAEKCNRRNIFVRG
jgi:SAM-dependent methyltransferase